MKTGITGDIFYHLPMEKQYKKWLSGAKSMHMIILQRKIKWYGRGQVYHLQIQTITRKKRVESCLICLSHITLINTFLLKNRG
jgi:hypothetical protein